jgi:hypothetical protein
VKTCQSFPSSLCRVRRNAIAAFGTRNSSGLARLKRLKVNCFEASKDADAHQAALGLLICSLPVQRWMLRTSTSISMGGPGVPISNTSDFTNTSYNFVVAVVLLTSPHT